MNSHPQAPWEDAVWEDGQWLRLIDPRESDLSRNPLINLDHPAPDVASNAGKRLALYEALLASAERHLKMTGRHLNIYADIAELYAGIAHGVRFPRNGVAGHDGRKGDNHYMVKCIAPSNANDSVSVDMAANFSHLVVVKITSDFRVAGRLIARKDLPEGADSKVKLRWSALPEAPFNRADR